MQTAHTLIRLLHKNMQTVWPRSGWRSSLIRICIVCHSTKYFKKQLHKKQDLGKKKKNSTVDLPYITYIIIIIIIINFPFFCSWTSGFTNVSW